MATAIVATGQALLYHTPPQAAVAEGKAVVRGAEPQSRVGREPVRPCGTRLNKYERSRQLEKMWRT